MHASRGERCAVVQGQGARTSRSSGLRAPAARCADTTHRARKSGQRHLVEIRKPDQIIQPWQHGHGETKATCLWLKNLPRLTPSNIVEGRDGRVWKMPPSADRWKERSRTLLGIAGAMAKQWTLAVEVETLRKKFEPRPMTTENPTLPRNSEDNEDRVWQLWFIPGELSAKSGVTESLIGSPPGKLYTAMEVSIVAGVAQAFMPVSIGKYEPRKVVNQGQTND